jgi:uncharacterized membrane protein
MTDQKQKRTVSLVLLILSSGLLVANLLTTFEPLNVTFWIRTLALTLIVVGMSIALYSSGK